jgi:Glycosyl hydrolase family 3 C-terminal domain/Glycosyl hydrolase family 3 N terminal domain
VSWVCLLLLLAAMTLEEKVGQMTQAERGAVTDDPSLVTTWRLGSLLSGGGSVPTPNTPEAWADMVDGFQERALETRLGIPLIYGADSVHGHGNLVGATVFPHNIGLGRPASSWSARPPTPRGSATSAGRCGRTTGCRASPRRCGCRTPTGPPSTGFCGSIGKCVVVVVSGRPLVLTDQLGKMDALVASWLPGSQGEGVADVLFGERPFTGRLSMTWPRSLEQEPINVGDRDYHPLFPYDFGLRTSVR